jgi:hypothetical protein
VADVLLYDRLVIPYPPNEAEVERWKTSGWDPDVLRTACKYLGIWQRPCHGTKSVKRQFKDRWSTARNLDPSGVGTIRPIAAYQSWDDFKASFNPQPLTVVQRGDAGRLMAVLAHEFLVPENPQADDLKNLEQATAIAKDEEFRGFYLILWHSSEHAGAWQFLI